MDCDRTTTGNNIVYKKCSTTALENKYNEMSAALNNSNNKNNNVKDKYDELKNEIDLLKQIRNMLV